MSHSLDGLPCEGELPDGLGSTAAAALLVRLPFALFDAELRHHFVTPAWAALLGADAPALRGHRWDAAAALPPEFGVDLRRVMEEGGVRRSEICLPRPEGRCRRLHLEFRALLQGDFRGVLVAAEEVFPPRDCDPVSYRQRRQLELAARIARLGYWHYDFLRGEFYWSPELWRIVGRTPEAFPLDADSRFLIFHPEDREERRRVWERAQAEGREFEHEARILRPDGTVRRVFAKGLPQFGSGGTVTGYFGILQDVTEERRVRDALDRERGRLEKLNGELEEAKREAERVRDLLREATSVLFDGFALFDPEDRIVLCNEAFSRFYEAAPEDLVGLTFEELQRLPVFRSRLGLDEEAFELWLARRIQLHRAGSEQPREIVGGGVHFLVYERRLSDGSIVLGRTDITALKRTEAELRSLARALAASKAEAEEAHGLLREATATLSEGFALFDAEDRLLLCNRSFSALHGAEPEELVGRSYGWIVESYLARFGPERDSPEYESFRERALHRFAVAEGAPLEVEAGDRWYVVRVHRMSNGYRVLLRSEVTHLKRVEEELRRLATIDDLTELYNRRAFFERGRRLLERCRQSGQPAALVLFDLDHFKAINDTYGHEAGDRVLTAVAERCRRVLRPGDLLARLGGEEFAVLLPDTGRIAAVRIAERLRRVIAETGIPVRDRELRVTASLGVAVPENAPGGLDPLLAAADRALYRAKGKGRDRVVVAEPGGAIPTRS